jgi:hypothetical protein
VQRIQPEALVQIISVLLSLTLIGACSSSHKTRKATDQAADAEATGPTTAAEDAEGLGHEIYDLVDRAMSYRSAHRGHLPGSLKELGVDELTRTTARTLVTTDGIPEVAVAYRSSTNHLLASCRGNSGILDEAALSGGGFSVICTTVAGGSTTLQAHR